MQHLFFLSCIFLLSGCTAKKENIEQMSLSTLYHSGVERLMKHQYDKAASYFEEVDKQHPYSPWASKAQLMAGFSFYRGQKYVESESTFDTFLDLHPGHSHGAYATYMVGLCQYEQLTTVQRDQEAALKSLATFQKLIIRHPETLYARDAIFHIALIHDHLAGKELDIARFYLRKGAHEAAIPRLQTVVQKYDKTLQVREALYRLVFAYLSLGLVEEAQAVVAVFGHNYPESHWYTEAYQLITTYNK